MPALAVCPSRTGRSLLAGVDRAAALAIELRDDFLLDLDGVGYRLLGHG
jgi:hypothetical protein